MTGPDARTGPDPRRRATETALPGWLHALTLYLRGALMGIADVIPGVSGGTVALVVGVYERLILGLSTLFRVPVRFLRAGWGAGTRAVREVPWPFLVTLGLGIGTALVVGAHVIPGIYARWTVQANALFFGLILGSVAVPWHRIRVPRPQLVAVAAVSAVVVFLLVGLPDREEAEPVPLQAFGGAMVAVTAMVLPGVSGSYLLHVMGLWVPTLEAVRVLDWAYLGVFAAGGVVGAVAIVLIVSWLLRRHHDVTLAVLVGFMVGALRALWPWTDETDTMVLPGFTVDVLAVPLILMITGFLFVRLLDTWGRKQVAEHMERPPPH